MNEAKELTRKMRKAKITVEALLSAWETGDLSQTASLLIDNFEVTGAAPYPLTREEFVMFQRVHHEAFPDWTFHVSDIRVKGDKVYVTYRIRATHKGIYDLSKLGMMFQSIQPTGQSWPWSVEHMTCTVKNDKINEIRIDTAYGNWVKGIVEWLGIKLPIPTV
jgi:predicted ester cyclase